MKRILFILVFLYAYSSIACDYTVKLHDTFGNGWSGNTVTISVNGAVVLSQITVDNGSDADFNFSANAGDIVEVTYNPTGTFQSENEIRIINNNLGNTIFSSGLNRTQPTNGSFTVRDNCRLDIPNNNEPCSALELPVSNDCSPISSNNMGAISGFADVPSCGNNNSEIADVWYKTTVNSAGVLQINITNTELDIALAVYSGDNCSNLEEIGCSTSGHFYSNEIPSGSPVWIRVWSENNDYGDFDICASGTAALNIDTDTYTPEELIEDVLITGCLEAYNVQYTGDPDALAFFESDGFDFSRGIIMTTGNATNAIGPNNSGGAGNDNDGLDDDSDLQELSGVQPHDVAILEFDFVPSSDIVKFKYIFASEEYDEYVCGTVNDVFGFFISGPGINGPYEDNAINVALVPGTNIPVSINTVNNGSVGTSGNTMNCDGGSDYYLGNSDYFQNDPFSQEMQYDGYTVALEAVMTLQACETYHIKLKIADGGDSSFDSAVMFEAGSFSSGEKATMNSVSPVGAANDLYEGCQNFYVFERIDKSAVGLSDSILIQLDVDGTATEGVDYTEIPDTMYLLPGMEQDTLYYAAFFDNINEGDEYIVFSLINPCPCDTVITEDNIIRDTIWIKNNYPLESQIIPIQDTICEGEEIVINTQINPNLDPLLVSYAWNAGFPQYTTPAITVSPTASTTYQVTITNVCHISEEQSSYINVVPTIDPTFSFSDDTVCVGEPVSITFTGSATQYADFEWDDNGAYPGVLNTQGPHVTAWNTTGLKTVTLNINDQGCLANSEQSIYIREYSNLLLNTSSTDMSCFNTCDGTTTVISNSINAPFSYQWSTGHTTQTASNLCAGTYHVTVLDAYGCKDTTHVSLGKPSEMQYQISTDSTTCYGTSDGAIYLNVNQGTPPYSFHWSNGIITPNNINLQAGNYSLTITDQKGCEKIINNIEVKQPNKIITTIYGNHPVNGEEWICKGETEILSSASTGGVDPYTYHWNTSQTTSNITVQPNETTSYYVQATDNRGCKSDTLRIKVNVYDDVTFNANFTPQSVCSGDTISLDIDAFGGNGQYIYVIENMTDSLVTLNDTYPLILPQSQNITVTVMDNCGSPYSSKSTNVQIHPNPEVSFTSNLTSGCEPLEVAFKETLGTEGNTYLWKYYNDIDYSDISTLANPTHIFSKNGIYHVKLEVTNAFGCTSSLEEENYLVVFNTPVADFRPKRSVHTIVDRTFYFDNASEDGYYYSWDFGDGLFDSVPNPAHTFPNAIRNYDVKLVTTSFHGCVDSTIRRIEVINEPTLYVPNAFTPDGDYINETFRIVGNGIQAEGFLLIIYDRWGMEIFRTTNPEDFWDGKGRDGNYVKSDVYNWVLKYRDANNVPREKSGTVKVIG